ncbi:MAG: hypothetical protein JWO10_1043, partial [Microbacteriaceae bacterium]|nr:hypothetical protein [Microbacteriaceae bacterium]
WCDLATVLTQADLLAAGDFILWRRRRELQVERPELAEAVTRHRARRGRPLLLETFPMLSDRADSPAESIMRLHFLRAGLPPAEVNGEVRDPEGRFIGMPDLSFPEFHVAFDYEGDVHRTDARQWAKDLKRAPRFEDAGWSYLRGGAPDLIRPSELIAMLRRRLLTGGWVPVSPVKSGNRLSRRPNADRLPDFSGGF